MHAVINGNKIHYVESGASGGLPVVLIHGFPFSHEMWVPQIEALKGEFRVIAYDHRGFGQSGVGDGQCMLEFYVDDLIALLDHLKIGKAVLCGLSMGGYVALRAVERNPERVLALILADTQSKADNNEGKLRRAAGIRSVKAEGTSTYAENFVKTAFAPKSLAERLESVENIKRIIRSNSSLGVCGGLLALASRTDTTEALQSIKVPTLILVGEHDKLTPPAASEEMHHKIPKSGFHIISGAAHISNLENSEEFNKHVLSFLAGLTG